MGALAPALAGSASALSPRALRPLGIPPGIETRESYRLGSMMRQLGYSSALEKPDAFGRRTLYLADGTQYVVPNAANKHVITPRDLGMRPDSAGGGGPEPYYYDLNWVNSDTSGNIMTWYNAENIEIEQYWYNTIIAPYGNFVAVIGPSYSSAAQIAAACVDQIKDCAASAVAAATYIAKSTTFGSIATLASRNFLARWGGVWAAGPVGAALAYAIEFMAAVAATLTVGEWIGLGLAIAFTSATAFSLWMCLTKGPA